MEDKQLCYKDLMMPVPNDLYIDQNETISTALKHIYRHESQVMIVNSGQDGSFRGILTPKSLLSALAEGKQLTDSLKGLSLSDYIVAEMNDFLDYKQLEQYPIHVVMSSPKTVNGLVTKEAYLKKLVTMMNRKWYRLLENYQFMGKYRSALSSAELQKNMNEPNLYAMEEGVKAILESNKRLWNILQYSPNSIYIADGQGDTLYVNHAFEKSSQLNVKDIMGVNVLDLEKKGFFNPAVTPIVLREEKPCTIKQQGIDQEWWIVSGVPVFDEAGRIDMVVTNAMDLEEITTLKTYIEKNNEYQVIASSDLSSIDKIISNGRHMQEIIDLVDRVAELDTTVLITGESGVGKGVISRYIHSKSHRGKENLIEINCSAIPESLFESELFGYETGAFSGAKVGGKPGLIEMANNGTLVLDEIGDMPLTLQSKLLKVLQDKKLTRVGGLKEREIDVRFIASTNQSLEKLMEKGLFRVDLYYRLNVFPIHLLPLRERMEEIPALVKYYLAYYNQKHQKRIRFTERALKTVRGYPWYGNIRELMFFVERMIIMHDQVVDDVDLREIEWFRKDDRGPISVNRIIPLKMALDETERQLFLLAAQKGSSSYEVAEILGTSQPNAYRKLKKYVKSQNQ